MPRIVCIVLVALAAGTVALESCGTANYDPSQYSCFNNSLLCPIVNGDVYQACGEACYSRGAYTCFNGDFLCPFNGGIATQRCGTGDICYSPLEYSCNSDGSISPLPSCSSGPSQVCDTQGCLSLNCCPGLIDIADHCRDPCQLAPSLCPNGTNPFLPHN
ncbi:carbohydrate binding-domain-containing protein [Mycena epipterygia]|nr:carbohydrate binding-domain-containing protein [Mycena epipterygia]